MPCSRIPALIALLLLTGCGGDEPETTAAPPTGRPEARDAAAEIAGAADAAMQRAAAEAEQRLDAAREAVEAFRYRAGRRLAVIEEHLRAARQAAEDEAVDAADELEGLFADIDQRLVSARTRLAELIDVDPVDDDVETRQQSITTLLDEIDDLVEHAVERTAALRIAEPAPIPDPASLPTEPRPASPK